MQMIGKFIREIHLHDYSGDLQYLTTGGRFNSHLELTHQRTILSSLILHFTAPPASLR